MISRNMIRISYRNVFSAWILGENHSSTACFLIPHTIKHNILNWCPAQDRIEGWDAMKPLYWRSVNSKGAGRPRLSHHHKGWWNETKWMWRNGGIKFVVGENGRNAEKNLPRPRFVHQETHMEWPRRELETRAVGDRLLMEGSEYH